MPLDVSVNVGRHNDSSGRARLGSVDIAAFIAVSTWPMNHGQAHRDHFAAFADVFAPQLGRFAKSQAYNAEIKITL